MINSSVLPLAAADVDRVVSAAVDALTGALDEDWTRPAAGLDWSCWETIEHTADDLFAYAGQIAPKRPALTGHVPFAWQRKRPDGPAATIFGDPAYGQAGLLQVLDASGALLTAMVATADPATRGHHIFGVSDPDGFAAMGVVEVAVHTHDVAGALDLLWSPPTDACERALRRLFPQAPHDTDPWDTLLWATGRGELPGHPRLAEWRWYGEPR
ncbi:hypothetical protein Lfu02_70440 [Longispora fulva]|uniref:DinB-like domain-containing protein n=1 Tax=Longispora fulva TaxID=619741 RepID=A0A8J7GBH8_9ACTN|nr:DinB family protein [Longispora fulva]MBG6134411.1 hypothetical protein [Longispora fulva]GIG62672.1 hypothetical protein Lfu02_70440 [Longispora fulva]